MAYSSEQWERAKAYYEAGQHTPQQIADIVGIERSTIVKKAKSHNWQSCENADYIEARQIIAVKKSQLNSQTLQVLDDIADEQIRYKRLINDNATKLANKLASLADQVDTASDIKTLAEANDRLAITLKVAERHAPKGDINVQSNTQVNNQPIEIKFVE